MNEAVLHGFALGIILGFCGVLANDTGNQEYSIKAICVSTDFSPHEEAIIEKSVRIWNFDRTHFVFNCDPGSILVKKDSTAHMNEIHGSSGTVGLSIFNWNEILIANILPDDKWLAWVAAHESGHWIGVGHINPKFVAIMDRTARIEEINNLQLSQYDLAEYCRVWNCTKKGI